MKKRALTIFINIFTSVLIIFTVDYAFFKYTAYPYIKADNNIRYKTFDINSRKADTTNVYKYFLEKKFYNKVIIPETVEKPPVILFGCSYTYMHDYDGLQYLLAQYTRRPVFNFAFWGWGAQHMYWLTQKDLLYKIIDSEHFNQNPEYAVYTYIRDHKNRMYSVQDYLLDIEPYLNYKKVDGKLKIKEYSYFHKLLFRLFTYRYAVNKLKHEHNNKQAFEMLYELITESKKELEKHYPNIKFVVFEYSQDKENIEEENQMFEKLKQNGIIYISTKDLTDKNLFDKEYTESDGYHPDTAAWELIVPELAKKFN